jgi:polar amino acid transport system permease protein
MSLRSFGWNEFVFLLWSVRWTVLLSLIAFAGGGALGLLIAALRIAPVRWLRWATDAWITLFQGTPVLVQLLLVYYGSSFIGFTPDAWIAASLTFVLNSSAFFGEIWRGCLEAIPRGQWDGARALGLRYPLALRLVVLPQALRLMVGPTIGYAVQIVKGTSVASLIGITELTRSSVMVNTVTFEPVRVFGTVCLIYFVICFPLSMAAERIGRRLDQRRTAGLGDLLRARRPRPRPPGPRAVTTPAAGRIPRPFPGS